MTAARFRAFSDTLLSKNETLINRERHRRYVCLAADVFNFMAKKLQSFDSSHFKHFPITWEKFPDGTDNITISGFSPRNEIAGEHVVFFASFHNNDITLSQISVLIVLLQSFIESLTIVLPFYPVGTNERVEVEGRVATANTYATLLSNLPSIGRPIRIMIYDIHALQNRFYFHGSVVPSLHTSIPLLFTKLSTMGVSSACFPDEGAAKRFGKIFREAGWELVVCGKVRDGEIRRVTVQDGDPLGEQLFL
jgi:phosphoribosylpyrophosphate synthetase